MEARTERTISATSTRTGPEIRKKIIIIKVKRIRKELRALGSFYEAIISLMVVTVGIVLLTSSFTLLAANGVEGAEDRLQKECRKTMDSLLSNRTLFFEARMFDHCMGSHMKTGPTYDLDGIYGIKVMLTEIGGGTEVLSLVGEEKNVKDRSVLSEPVNIYHAPGDVRAGSLIVWVWR